MELKKCWSFCLFYPLIMALELPALTAPFIHNVLYVCVCVSRRKPTSYFLVCKILSPELELEPPDF